MALKRRLLEIEFALGEGSFGTDGQNVVKLTGHRVSAKIVKAGGNSMGSAQLQIYGMSLSQMNRLSTLGMQITLERRNVITISVGAEGETMAAVFIGTIKSAWMDAGSMPNVPFHVEAYAGLFESVRPIPASSFAGSADVATIMLGLATKMGLDFENNGVDKKLSNQYLSGSGRAQAQKLAENAGIELAFDVGKLVIWNPGQARGGLVPLVSPATGLVKYPSYTSTGVVLQTVFNPSISFGGTIEIQSDLKPACGRWVVYMLDHSLDTLVPRGNWFTNIQAARPGFIVVR